MSCRQEYELKILHKNEFGYAAYCTCCKNIQFVLGNVISRVSVDVFYRLEKSFENLKKDLSSLINKMPDGERILIQTPLEEITLCLTIEEFMQSINIFNQGSLMLQVHQLLNEDVV